MRAQFRASEVKLVTLLSAVKLVTILLHATKIFEGYIKRDTVRLRAISRSFCYGYVRRKTFTDD